MTFQVIVVVKIFLCFPPHDNKKWTPLLLYKPDIQPSIRLFGNFEVFPNNNFRMRTMMINKGETDTDDRSDILPAHFQNTLCGLGTTKRYNRPPQTEAMI
jgi:hypothetical protein